MNVKEQQSSKEAQLQRAMSHQGAPFKSSNCSSTEKVQHYIQTSMNACIQGQLHYVAEKHSGRFNKILPLHSLVNILAVNWSSRFPHWPFLVFLSISERKTTALRAMSLADSKWSAVTFQISHALIRCHSLWPHYTHIYTHAPSVHRSQHSELHASYFPPHKAKCAFKTDPEFFHKSSLLI